MRGRKEGAGPSLSCASLIIFPTFHCVSATQFAWPLKTFKRFSCNRFGKINSETHT